MVAKTLSSRNLDLKKVSFFFFFFFFLWIVLPKPVTVLYMSVNNNVKCETRDSFTYDSNQGYSIIRHLLINSNFHINIFEVNILSQIEMIIYLWTILISTAILELTTHCNWRDRREAKQKSYNWKGKEVW